MSNTNGYSIPDSCHLIATNAALRAHMAGEDIPTAVREAAAVMRSSAKGILSRASGAELTYDNAELTAMYLSVAGDVLHGNVSRPSVGNVRTYTEQLTRAILRSDY